MTNAMIMCLHNNNNTFAVRTHRARCISGGRDATERTLALVLTTHNNNKRKLMAQNLQCTCNKCRANIKHKRSEPIEKYMFIHTGSILRCIIVYYCIRRNANYILNTCISLCRRLWTEITNAASQQQQRRRRRLPRHFAQNMLTGKSSD